ncbi:MAG: hypothetical protein R3E65_12780 [Steroidobacteraceae bacterium]
MPRPHIGRPLAVAGRWQRLDTDLCEHAHAVQFCWPSGREASVSREASQPGQPLPQGAFGEPGLPACRAQGQRAQRGAVTGAGVGSRAAKALASSTAAPCAAMLGDGCRMASDRRGGLWGLFVC